MGNGQRGRHKLDPWWGCRYGQEEKQQAGRQLEENVVGRADDPKKLETGSGTQGPPASEN